ncbi:arginine N-methyltransferase 2 [Trichodelitschia bisporula]|uniref:Arginine N-methyltransferase 2 n=1 Tax=Trichodelitschia bisporula TaxID=703511 RepID=A0A6G1I1M6_9PEZI|nr:arginine N-methyltransferase 2 [Trichodelitschia bisporula]
MSQSNEPLNGMAEPTDLLDGMDVEVDLTTQSLLLAAAHHDLSALKDLLRTSSATVVDPETGFTPLHAAVASLELDEEDKEGNEEERTQRRKEELEKGAETVRLLLQNGAIWNDLDSNDETAGCIARRLGLDEIYGLIVDAGCRAELLLRALEQYQPLGDDSDEDDDEEGEGDVVATEVADAEPEAKAADAMDTDTAVAVDPSTSNAAYLSSTLTQAPRAILDAGLNGVMMDWETPLMERHAELLLPTPGLRVLNVGHGMGIIDTFLQKHGPSSHHIIEAHPEVVASMKEKGWDKKPGVVVHEGRWQDVLPELIARSAETGEELVFDSVYFDTFAEDYGALKEFFSEWMIQFLDAEGRFGFFNGMGADRQVCYDVYTKVVEMDLFEAGFDVNWEDIKVQNLQEAGEWDGVRRPYFVADTYKLPTCKFMG